MEINLQSLLEGKGTIIKNKEYYPTKNYVEPFIEKLSKITDDFKFMVKMPDQMTTGSNNLDKTFNKVWAQAKLPDSYSHGDYDQVIGFIYGIDVRKPVVKFYRGIINSKNSNFYIFNPTWLMLQELEPESPIDFNPIKGLLELTDDSKIWIDKLENTEVLRSNREEQLGKWIHKSIVYDYNNGLTQKVKLGTADAIGAYKQLFIDSNSDFYINADSNTNILEIYDAFASQLAKSQEKDLINTVEKTLLLKEILGIQ